MKKQIKKLSLHKATISNLGQVKGGAIVPLRTRNIWLCWTTPENCETTQISACTACYSCIECPPPPETSLVVDCGCNGTIIDL
jgi:hypothetical protein